MVNGAAKQMGSLSTGDVQLANLYETNVILYNLCDLKQKKKNIF